jgi:hypothetical protein
MSVKVKNGIGFSSRTGAVYMDMAVAGNSQYDPARPVKNVPVDNSVDRISAWAKWGADNQLPLQMLAEIEKCGILNSIIDGKARFAVCNGILPALVHYDKGGQMVVDDIVMDPEISDFLDDNNHFFHTFSWMKDQCAFGNGVARFMLNGGRDKIASFQRDDITEMRYQKQDTYTGRIDNIFLSAYWDKVGNNPLDYRIIKTPLLHWNNPLEDLRKKVSGSNQNEFALTFRYPGWNRKYYSMPLWYAALLWVRIAQGVPEMKAAMFKNNFRPKYMVIISEKYWDRVFEKDVNGQTKIADDYTAEQIEEKKQKVYDDIDEHLFGNENAYKTIFVDGYYDQSGKLIPEIEIKPIEDTTKNGEFLPDSAAANSEIAFAMLFNPAIIGANMPSGPYTNSQGGSNVRESTLIQVIIHELERQNVRRIFNVIKRFNNWDKQFAKTGQKLEFIIPATIPTTLDTGSNVKPMVTGVSPADNSANNKTPSSNGTN